MYTTLFASLFNQGQLLARENKIDEALNKYQEALALNSESIEVKTNIELLMQQKQGGGQGEGDSKDNKDEKTKITMAKTKKTANPKMIKKVRTSRAISLKITQAVQNISRATLKVN